jgi:predicted RND superfamily exporter protein
MGLFDDPLGTVERWVVERSRTVVIAFLAVTLLFGLGLGAVSTEAGTEQFTEGTPAQEAFEDVTREFDPRFGGDTGTTQLIQSERNVLSQTALLGMLEALDRLDGQPGLRVNTTTSAAATVATTIDPNATTLDAQRRVLRETTPSRIDAAVREAASRPGFRSQLSDDFNRRSATASATVAVVTHELPAALDDAAGGGMESPLTSIQLEARTLVSQADSDIRVFGSGIIAAEFSRVIFDSLIVVVPAAIVLILVFLVISYRDPFDLLLGTLSLGLTLVWTFGFMGLAGIPFTQFLIAVPPLLLAVGIDFGIHTINRYREERVTGRGVDDAIARAFDQLLVAFFIVTGTTVLGFSANLTSSLAPIRDFGLVAAVGIAFTFLVFGIFLPAAKAESDRLRDRLNLPAFGQQPLGSEGSRLGRVLSVGVVIARRAPTAFLIVVLVGSAASGWYATGIDTSFSQEDFLPPAETPAVLADLPEPFRPGEYTVTREIDFLEDNFQSAEGDSVTIYVQGPLAVDYALESIQRAARNPPDSFVAQGRRARTESILDVIDQRASESADFRALVARNDVDGDGVPDDNLPTIYDALLDSPRRAAALEFITEDRRSTQVVFTTKGGADQAVVTADARAVAERYRFRATATGEIVVFQSIAALILRSAIRSLAVALAATAVFLVVVYKLLEDRPSLGLVNLVPIVVTVALIAGSMRALGISFNAFTATILSITIGLGIDYSAHIVHRFVDEYESVTVTADASTLPAVGATTDVYEALTRTVTGTGGALTGSMLTTTTGIGVLVLAVTPILGQFGLLTALSILYSFLTSIVVTPSALVVWDRLVS